MSTGKRIYCCILMILSLGLSLSGCGVASGSQASGKTYEVDQTLQEFYNSLGGETVLGPAISKLMDDPSGQCQYTANVQLCVNPLIVGEERYSLSPLGVFLGLSEAANSSSSSDGLQVNGFIVYEEFVPIYEQFSQSDNVGNPISQVHINYAQQRIEQYFEKVGFYRSFNDASGEVRLLAFGAASCSKDCKFNPAEESRLIDLQQNTDYQSLMEGLNDIPDMEVFGNPLSEPFTVADGTLEQVFEGVVLYQNPNGVVKPRPISILLEMLTTEPSEKIYGQDDGMVFYAVDGTLGYHVPVLFYEFISTHGGTTFSGDPIAEVIEYQPGIFRQCFTNYCLDYTPEARKNKRITVAPLGQQYLQLELNETVPQPTEQPEPQEIILQVFEDSAKVSATETQTINIKVFDGSDDKPLSAIQSSIQLNLPRGKTWSSDLDPTNAEGESSITLPVMKNIPNGTILTYQVCLKNMVSGSVCVRGSYLVWTAP